MSQDTDTNGFDLKEGIMRLTSESVGAIRDLWRMAWESDGGVIVIRHAKRLGPHIRSGLSFEGMEMARQYAVAAENPAIIDLIGHDRLLAVATPTLRTAQTLSILVGNHVPIDCPPAFELPNLGPGDCDWVLAGELASRHGIERNEAYLRLEELGATRVGEHPDAVARRIRRGIFDLAERNMGKVIVVCGYTPGCNMALDVPGTLSELEAVSAYWEDGELVTYSRCKPEFSD